LSSTFFAALFSQRGPTWCLIYNSNVMDGLVIEVSEAEATRDFASLLMQARGGAEIVIKNGAWPVAVVRPAEPPVRRLSESLRLAQEHGSSATLEEDFAKDLEAAVGSHREPLATPEERRNR